MVRPRQVFCADITYMPMRRGFMYLVAVLDWFSRYVVAWKTSNTRDKSFCIEALQKSLGVAVPELFNTDQGAQFTCDAFVTELLRRGVRVSMDGNGRTLDNVYVERLWRLVKYEEVYLNEYASMSEGTRSLGSTSVSTTRSALIRRWDTERPRRSGRALTWALIPSYAARHRRWRCNAHSPTGQILQQARTQGARLFNHPPRSFCLKARGHFTPLDESHTANCDG